MEFGVTPRRHNPVDSICRKLQTIQRRDRESNSPFQIPKLQSSSYDSPHTGLRRNLDSVLKKRKGDAEQTSTSLLLTPGTSRTSGRTRGVPVTPLSPVNATYTITGTLAEKSSVAPGHSRAWQLSCSTPAIQNGDARFGFTPAIQNSDTRFGFTPAIQNGDTRFSSTPSTQNGDARFGFTSAIQSGDARLSFLPSEKERSKALPQGLRSYNLNFGSSDTSTILDCELPYPALVVKRLSMGDGTYPSNPIHIPNTLTVF